MKLIGVDTVNRKPLLAAPDTVTMTFPVVAPAGTGTVIPEVAHCVGVAGVPLNVTVLVPFVVPKFDPRMFTDVPTSPHVGFRPVMFGVVGTVKLTPLLAWPETVTTTFPVVAPVGTVVTILVALQKVGDESLPLNVTVLIPSVDPKFDPVIVTEVPTAPEFGLRLVMLGGVARA